MTSLNSTNTRWRRATTGAVASGALVAGMLAGMPSALAEPVSPVTPGGAASPTTPAEAAPGSPVTPGGSAAGAMANDAQAGDAALQAIAAEYDTGNGGGQVSQLIHSVMLLRSQGYYPSKGNVIALQEGLAKRPNQVPLRTALEQTLSYQRRAQQRGMMQQSQSPTSFGIGQIPPGSGQPINIGSPLDIPQG